MLVTMWGMVGTVVFWLLWPLWIIYFKFSNTRSRVLVVVDNEILVVVGWLGNKKWSLPGGGVKRRESTLASAIRELREETGVAAVESNTKTLGVKKHDRYGFKYKEEYFVLQLSAKPKLILGKPEILSAHWISLDSEANTKLGEDTIYALKRYRPPEQASLL